MAELAPPAAGPSLSSDSPDTCGVLVIGNEVLSAKVADENGPFLIGRLRSLGVELRRMCTVVDELDEIVWALRSLRRRCDWVVTTGGIGPTHDDVTVAAVAAALGRAVVRSAEVETLIRGYWPGEPPPAAFRMADVPEGAELVVTEGTRLPTVIVDRVALLPGVPSLMRRQFEAVAPRLRGAPFVLRQVFLSVSEPQIAAVLDRVARAFPAVALGSYPRLEREADHSVKLTLEGRAPDSVAAALSALLAALPAGAVLRTD